MTPSWELLCALALSFVGLLALAAAMDRHQRDLAGRTFAARSGRLLRVAGWLLLMASTLPMVARWGALTGLLLWGALISLPAIALVLAITLRARATGSGKPARPARQRTAK
ncbi:DUF3325 domain-containing protein [Pseudomonas paralcaligenes]|uniref:DUF3325 domain-containing protein n=1 Tax=Pseudomonas paralcaligenes TaxID=2772558 RepID=UPI001C7F1FBE|nr:DUF3325 domain-containing protein [Pseudomonas paralcaligenes]